MNREIHVPLREGVGVKFPCATRPLSENKHNRRSHTHYRRVQSEIRPAQGYSDRWPAFYDGRNSNVGLRTLTLGAG